MTEEQAVDKIIEIGRRFIDYSNTSKLRNLGVKIASVKLLMEVHYIQVI